jgi:hypothetical protein
MHINLRTIVEHDELGVENEPVPLFRRASQVISDFQTPISGYSAVSGISAFA